MENTVIIGNGLSYFDISPKDIKNGFEEFQLALNRKKLKKLKTSVKFKLNYSLQTT